MSVLNMKYIGASVLNRKAKPIRNITPEVIDLAQNMLETMYKYNGVGLAAPQIGVSKRMLLIDCGESYQKEPFILINPKIIEHKGTQIGDEGCLSLPGVYLPVARADYVTVEYMNLSGETMTLEGNQLLSRCIQHEIDHLDGVLFTEMVQNKADAKAIMPVLKDRISKILKGEISPFTTEWEENENEEILEEKEEVSV